MSAIDRLIGKQNVETCEDRSRSYNRRVVDDKARNDVYHMTSHPTSVQLQRTNQQCSYLKPNGYGVLRDGSKGYFVNSPHSPNNYNVESSSSESAYRNENISVDSASLSGSAINQSKGLHIDAKLKRKSGLSGNDQRQRKILKDHFQADIDPLILGSNVLSGVDVRRANKQSCYEVKGYGCTDSYLTYYKTSGINGGQTMHSSFAESQIELYEPKYQKKRSTEVRSQSDIIQPHDQDKYIDTNKYITKPQTNGIIQRTQGQKMYPLTAKCQADNIQPHDDTESLENQSSSSMLKSGVTSGDGERNLRRKVQDSVIHRDYTVNSNTSNKRQANDYTDPAQMFCNYKGQWNERISHTSSLLRNEPQLHDNGDFRNPSLNHPRQDQHHLSPDGGTDKAKNRDYSYTRQSTMKSHNISKLLHHQSLEIPLYKQKKPHNMKLQDKSFNKNQVRGCSHSAQESQTKLDKSSDVFDRSRTVLLYKQKKPCNIESPDEGSDQTRGYSNDIEQSTTKEYETSEMIIPQYKSKNLRNIQLQNNGNSRFSDSTQESAMKAREKSLTKTKHNPAYSYLGCSKEHRKPALSHNQREVSKNNEGEPIINKDRLLFRKKYSKDHDITKMKYPITSMYLKRQEGCEKKHSELFKSCSNEKKVQDIQAFLLKSGSCTNSGNQRKGSNGKTGNIPKEHTKSNKESVQTNYLLIDSSSHSLSSTEGNDKSGQLRSPSNKPEPEPEPEPDLDDTKVRDSNAFSSPKKTDTTTTTAAIRTERKKKKMHELMQSRNRAMKSQLKPTCKKSRDEIQKIQMMALSLEANDAYGASVDGEKVPAPTDETDQTEQFENCDRGIKIKSIESDVPLLEDNKEVGGFEQFEFTSITSNRNDTEPAVSSDTDDSSTIAGLDTRKSHKDKDCDTIPTVNESQTDESSEHNLDIALASVIETKTNEHDDDGCFPGYTIWNAERGMEFRTIQGSPSTEEGVMVSISDSFRRESSSIANFRSVVEERGMVVVAESVEKDELVESYKDMVVGSSDSRTTVEKDEAVEGYEDIVVGGSSDSKIEDCTTQFTIIDKENSTISAGSKKGNNDKEKTKLRYSIVRVTSRGALMNEENDKKFGIQNKPEGGIEFSIMEGSHSSKNSGSVVALSPLDTVDMGRTREKNEEKDKSNEREYNNSGDTELNVAYTVVQGSPTREEGVEIDPVVKLLGDMEV